MSMAEFLPSEVPYKIRRKNCVKMAVRIVKKESKLTRTSAMLEGGSMLSRKRGGELDRQSAIVSE
jgi:hypothetical protein